MEYEVHVSRRPAGHGLEFDSDTLAGLPDTVDMLEFPHDDADREKEKKAGEKDGEEDEEVNVGLVLPEKDPAFGVVWCERLHALDDDIEFAVFEVELRVGDGENGAVPDVTDNDDLKYQKNLLH